MQTSLQRRRARRRNGGRGRSGGVARTAAVALPLFLFGTFLAVGRCRLRRRRLRVRVLRQGPARADRARGHRLQPAVDHLRPHRHGRAGPLRRASAARWSPSTRSRRPCSTPLTAIEDKTFWTNSGFDPVAIGSAALDTLRGDGRGASTITQQLVRQRLLDPALVQDPDRTVERKIKEIIQSIRVTQAYPGPGRQADGSSPPISTRTSTATTTTASSPRRKDYFGVSDLSKLTLGQAAILAAHPAVAQQLRPGAQRRGAGRRHAGRAASDARRSSSGATTSST